MIVLRIIGWIFVLLGLAVFGYDLWRWLVEGQAFGLITGGELWFMLDRESLNVAQAVIQRNVWAWLWDPAIVTVLLWPAALALFGFGLVLLVLFRRRPRRLFD
ncbi:MAG: hypothetical protein RLO50_17605 [Azospirillaceae bacterium]